MLCRFERRRCLCRQPYRGRIRLRSRAYVIAEGSRIGSAYAAVNIAPHTPVEILSARFRAGGRHGLDAPIDVLARFSALSLAARSISDAHLPTGHARLAAAHFGVRLDFGDSFRESPPRRDTRQRADMEP